MESMLSHRPYRPSNGLKEATNNNLHCKGVKLNAQIVDICLEILNDSNFSSED